MGIKMLLMLQLLLLSSAIVVAQNGKIKGVVTDEKTNEPLVGATVMLDGTTTGTVTDFDGNYEISSVPPGTYTVRCSFISYETKFEENVKITAGQELNLNFKLGESTVEIGDIKVVAKANRESEKILMVDRKEQTNLVQNIGAQELARVGAGDAAEGLKKVVGLSVQGTKFVVVRGLGDRYNSSTLNGFPIASPNPDRRILPYDIFPSDIIQSLEVTKSFSPFLYGDFSGASIDISTKPYPGDHTLEVSVGTSVNTKSTFKDFLIDPSHNDDILGINQTRELPSKVIEQDNDPDINYFDSDKGSGYNESNWFKTKFDPETKTAPVNKDISLKYGNLIELKSIGSDSKLGYLVNLNYGNSYNIESGRIAALQNVQGTMRYDYDFIEYKISSNISGLGNLFFQLNKNHQINYNFLSTILSENNVLETDGSFFDFDPYVYSRRMTYKKNSLFAHQVNISNSFFKEKLKLDWGGSISNAYANEPDRRQIALRYDPEKTVSERTYSMNSQDVADHHRFFTDLDDNDIAGKFMFEWKAIERLNENDEKNTVLSVKGGANYRNKKRDFWLRQFNHDFNGSITFDDKYSVDDFLTVDNLVADEYQVEEGTQPYDTYNASMEIMAPFMNFQYQLIPEKLEINVGARFEMSEQYIEYCEDDAQLQGIDPKTKESIESDDLFPSVIAKYNFSEQLILRGSYSKTVSRPDFRELAPFEYRESFGAFRTTGNPELQNGYNNNFDLRIENYDEKGGLLALGLFAKTLDSPIVQNVATGANPVKSFQNGEEGHVLGFEIEAKKSLDFITPKLKELTFNANLSMLTSEITIGDDSSSSTSQTSNKRKLEGASPYLVNVDMTYAKSLDKYKYSFTVAFNKFGRRLSSIGNSGVGDIFELSYGTLNVNSTIHFGEERKLGLKIFARNLLNPSIIVEQELTPDSDEKIELNNYKKGISTGISLTYKIF